MLIFSRQNLAYLAVPKTGSTAIEMALRPRADIVFAKHRKHLPARGFHNRVAPFLAKSFDLHPDRIAVLRDPVDQLSSWYRYRTSADLRGSDKSTADISFDQFVLDVISDDPPAHAGVGSQYRFLTSDQGEVLVHKLFAYSERRLLQGFLEDRFDAPLTFKSKNVSPQIDTPLSHETRERLRAARPEEFALYDRLMDADGVLDFALPQS